MLEADPELGGADARAEAARGLEALAAVALGVVVSGVVKVLEPELEDALALALDLNNEELRQECG